MSKFESNNNNDTSTREAQFPGSISLALAGFAEDIRLLNDINNKGLTIEIQLAQNHIRNEIAQATHKGEFHWTAPMTSLAHIVELYAKKDTSELIDGIHWDQRNGNITDSKNLDVLDALIIKKIQTKKRDLQLIGYLKLANMLGIKTGLYEDLKTAKSYRGDNTPVDTTILDNLGDEIDLIVSELREDLMI